MKEKVSLKEHFDDLREADLRYAQARFDAQEKAIALASTRSNIVSIIGIVVAVVAIVVTYLHK